MDRLVDVALPLPFQTPFTYRVPDGLPMPERGCRVVAPFGTRRAIGVVVGPASASPGEGLKELLEVVDEVSLVPPPLLDLAAFVASHYLAPPGECYRLVLPPAGIRASRAVVHLEAGQESQGGPVVAALVKDGSMPLAALARRLGRDPASQVARLRKAGVVRVEQDLGVAGFRQVQVAVLVRPEGIVRGAAQKEVIERLKQAGGRVPVAGLCRERPSLRGVLRRLAGAGIVELVEERSNRSPDVLPGGQVRDVEATTEQAQVLQTVLAAVAARRFEPSLLHGVTGSGKTEIYFRAAEKAVESGRAALFLVPEIALTPLLVRTAVARFGRTVCLLHSELSVGERHDEWWRIRDGEARVVVGARSAVFAPLPDPGLIVVDEEHDGAYKQEDSPRYHARDVAVMRARLEGVPVILGSATPAIESYVNARKGKYKAYGLLKRVGGSQLPTVHIIDRREQPRSEGEPILTPPLTLALQERLERGEQSLLLLNRRGYAASLLCRECGVQAECPHCSVTLTVHRTGKIVQCHYCGHQARTLVACPGCKGEFLRLAGYGTERVMEAIVAALPQARVARVDRDLAGRKGAVARVLATFEAGELDILVGTQMIAKGHDFPNVTLVGVVDADVGLGLPDFRAAERSFQLLTQVAGRAGRGALAGEVILQSHMPDHYALRLACNQDYPGFFEHEMEFRSTMAYPPQVALVNVILRAKKAAQGAEEADVLAKALRRATGSRFCVLGPAQAPLARLRGEYRFQLLLKGDRRAMRAAVRDALVERYGPTRWPGVAVDVDPVSVM